jgi:hypothetical protein
MVTMLPDHWAARLHHGSVMGGEVATRGTRGTHGECAKANVGWRGKAESTKSA